MENSKQLMKIDNARRELAEARTISETKTIHDKAEAIRIFTKQQNYSREIQDYATVFVLEAEIKLGKTEEDFMQAGVFFMMLHKSLRLSKIIPIKDNVEASDKSFDNARDLSIYSAMLCELMLYEQEKK